MSIVAIGIDPSLTSTGVSDGEQHILVKTSPAPGADPMEDLLDRSWAIAEGVVAFIGTRTVHLFIEAPMLAAHGGGAHTLFETGWLMHDLYCGVDGMCEGDVVAFTQVPRATLCKWAVGKGNIAKADMKLAVFKKFGVEFDNDPGSDKLFAYILARYGQAVLAGDIAPHQSKRRGEGSHARGAARRGLRTRGVL